MSHTGQFSVQEARLNQGLSISELAQQIGVSWATVKKIEDGRPVHPAMAKKVADYFGVTVIDVIWPARQGVTR